MAKAKDLNEDLGFYMFAVVMIALYAVPSTIYSFKRKTEEIKAPRYGQKPPSKFSGLFILNLVGLVVAWWALVHGIQFIQEQTTEGFDPYQILGVTDTDSMAHIKKTYRKLSRTYHPDKNPGNATAAHIFTRLVKAYETLTDFEAKANWMKYGHPDGQQAMLVALGVPSFLRHATVKQIFIASYLLALVVGIPSLFIFLGRRKPAEDQGPGGEDGESFAVSQQSLMLIEQTLQSRSDMSRKEIMDLVMRTPEVLRYANFSKPQRVFLDEKIAEMQKLGLMKKKAKSHPVLLRCVAILTAYLHQSKHPEIFSSVEPLATPILERVPYVIEALVSSALELNKKKIATSALVFLRLVLLALADDADMTEEVQRSLYSSASLTLPQRTLKVSGRKDEDGEIVIELQSVADNLKNGEQSHKVLTKLPIAKKDPRQIATKEFYWVIVEKQGTDRILAYDKIHPTGKEFTHEISIQEPQNFERVGLSVSMLSANCFYLDVTAPLTKDDIRVAETKSQEAAAEGAAEEAED